MKSTDHINAGAIVLTLEGRMDLHAGKIFRSATKTRSALCHTKLYSISIMFFSWIVRALAFCRWLPKTCEEAKICLSFEMTKGYVRQGLPLAKIGKTISISAPEGQPSPSGSLRLVPTPKDRLT